MPSGLISVPLASVIGAKYFRDTPGAMVLLMSAFVVWAAVLTFALGASNTASYDPTSVVF